MAGVVNLATHVAALTVALLATMPAHAEVPDPTRPPPGWADGAPAAAPSSSGLQQIIRRAGAKPAAVINGQRVELGGRVGDARLVEVSEDFVVLQGASGRETLYLTPGIGKKTARAASQGKDGAKP